MPFPNIAREGLVQDAVTDPGRVRFGAGMRTPALRPAVPPGAVPAVPRGAPIPLPAKAVLPVASVADADRVRFGAGMRRF